MSRKPKIACSLEPELAFLKNVKGVSRVFNRVFSQIFRELSEVEDDRLTAWTALVNGDLEVEVAIRPKTKSRSKQRQSATTPKKPIQRPATTKEDDKKSVLRDLVGKFENFEPNT